MDFQILGWADAEPTLDLDHREFPYAGKFIMTNTGKAVARGDPSHNESVTGDTATGIVAAASFSPDRTEADTLWIRYLTVRSDRQGEGFGPQLAEYVCAAALERGFERVRIAVNNPFSYQALYKAGFEFTGGETGMAELILERPGKADRTTYQRGLDVFRDRDLSASEKRFLSRKQGAPPPDPLDTVRS